MTPSFAGKARQALLLAFTSGVCGLAYEQLYARYLSTYLGDAFHVQASILICFLAGLALGSFGAARWSARLWLIEATIGVYALLLAALGAERVTQGGLALTSRVAAPQSASMMAIVLLLSIPATLVGFSVPLFSRLVGSSLAEDRSQAFEKTYLAYNLGAAFCVLAVEFFLLRSVGLSGSLMVIGTCNLVVAAALVVLGRTLSSVPTEHSAESSVSGVLKLKPAEWGALLVISSLSGVFQILALRLSEIVFGPFHENFSIVLFLALLGLAIGSGAVKRWRLKLGHALLLSSGALALCFAFLQPLVHYWAELGDLLQLSGGSRLGLKLSLMTIMLLAPFIALGATVPALASQYPERKGIVGKLLGVSSVGNCIGFLAMSFYFYEVLSYRATFLILVALSFGCALFHLGRGRVLVFGSVSVAILALLGARAWDEKLFYLSYHELAAESSLQQARSSILDYTVKKRLNSQVSLLERKSGDIEIVINGYKGLIVENGQTNPYETLFGVAPALYPPRRERALVLGLGTGITAGATSTMFKHTTAIEINPAMIELQPQFAEHNMRLHENPNVSIVSDDGLSFLEHNQEKFDAIINTVTSPLFFSSSKLYTRDAFELAKRNLREGGVYALYFDYWVMKEGARIIYKTLQESFKSCHFVYLRNGYCQLICSDSKLAPAVPAESQWPAPIREKLKRLAALEWRGGVIGLSTALEALILPAHRIFESDWGARANTFDLPTLEFEMAANNHYRMQALYDWSPYDFASTDYSRSAFRPGTLTADEIARRCFVIWAFSGYPNPFCERHIEADRSQSSKIALAQATLKSANQAKNAPGSKEERTRQIRALIDASQYKEVRPYLEGLWKQYPDDNRLRLLGLELDLREKGKAHRATLAFLYSRMPLDIELRALMALAARKEGLKDQYERHLRVLMSLNPDQETLNRLRRSD